VYMGRVSAFGNGNRGFESPPEIIIHCNGFVFKLRRRRYCVHFEKHILLQMLLFLSLEGVDVVCILRNMFYCKCFCF
jgi:hypothetical protein